MSSSTKVYMSTLSNHLDRHMYWLNKNLSLASTIKDIISHYPRTASPIASFLAQDGQTSAEELAYLLNQETEGRIQHSIIYFFTTYCDLNNNPRGLKSLKSFIKDSKNMKSLVDRDWRKDEELSWEEIDVD